MLPWISYSLGVRKKKCMQKFGRETSYKTIGTIAENEMRMGVRETDCKDWRWMNMAQICVQ
jgi:hypothetical protein